MKKKVMGIIGANGMVGRIVSDELDKYKKYTLRKGYKTAPPEQRQDRARWVFVDIYAPESLHNFCKGCDVVLNCAGPSFLIGDRVACAAGEVGAVYVDSYGTESIKKSLDARGLSQNVLYVLGAGVYPGLSGILSECVLQEGGSVSSYKGMSGSFEPIGRGAAEDLLYSTASGFGMANALWEGNRLKFLSSGTGKKFFIPQLNREVTAELFLNEEILRFIHKHALQKACWYNLPGEKRFRNLLASAYKVIMQQRGEEAFASVADKFMVESRGMGKPWNILVVETEGKQGGVVRKMRGVVSNASAYRLTGIVLARVALDVAGKEKLRGIHRPYEVVDCGNVLNEIRNSGIDVEIGSFTTSLFEDSSREEIVSGII